MKVGGGDYSSGARGASLMPPCYHAGLAAIAARRCAPFIWTICGPMNRPSRRGGGLRGLGGLIPIFRFKHNMGPQI